ncbi:MAG TPA: cation transporter, partial [Candidatus Gracilibacteria bacterium]|nr:cation transporter [Candidatus Gracilibacteria bacterium]
MKKAGKEPDNLSYGAKIALIGLGEFLILALIKAGVGFATGMIVLVADALASCSDMLTIFASYLGLRISKKSATKEFGYGYYKVETLAALIVSLVISYLGFVI